jgi:cob(I)alamin adenosyltransferase
VSDPPVIPPTSGPEISDRRRASSLVLVFTGDGKGKTTAAIGTVVRAVARGWKVCVVQFVKSGQWRSGEEEVGRRLGAEWWTLGRGFSWDSEDLDRDREAAARAWDFARETVKAGAFDLVVLDEITYPIVWGWIPADEVALTIRERPAHVHIVATGRDAPGALLAEADTVTEMRKVRHAFDAGIAARRGIDF